MALSSVELFQFNNISRLENNFCVLRLFECAHAKLMVFCFSLLVNMTKSQLNSYFVMFFLAGTTMKTKEKNYGRQSFL